MIPSMQTREVQRVVFAILWLNLAVAAAKGIYGFWSGSLAVASDAVHSLLDGASNVVGLVALRMAATPPDEGHPYGHHKIEIVAAAMVGILIAGGSLRFAWDAIDALVSGRHAPAVTISGYVTMGGTLAVNLFVATYEARRGRQLGSAFLQADAAHTASDIAVTVAVLVSLAVSHRGAAWADPVCALVVLVVIARVAWRILSSNLAVLLDRAVVNADHVREAVLAVSGVTGCHRIRSRGLEGATHVDLHLQVDGDLPLRDAHEISHRVEEKIRTDFPGVVDVTIHIEPEDEPEEGL
jgi:cation diffusion facilitator family transporter